MAGRNEPKNKVSTGKVKKLALKKEKLSDLNPRVAQTSVVRGQSTIIARGGTNHNETLVRLARRR